MSAGNFWSVLLAYFFHLRVLESSLMTTNFDDFASFSFFLSALSFLSYQARRLIWILSSLSVSILAFRAFLCFACSMRFSRAFFVPAPGKQEAMPLVGFVLFFVDGSPDLLRP